MTKTLRGGPAERPIGAAHRRAQAATVVASSEGALSPWASSADADPGVGPGVGPDDPVPLRRSKALVPRLRSWPTKAASISNVVISTPALLVQTWALSLPCTTTGSPRRRERSQFSARERQAFTAYHWVSPSSQVSVRRW